MDNYIVPVSKGLLAIKHKLLVNNILGLFLFLLDRTTQEENGEGLVLGGAPIPYKDIAQTIGSSVDSIKRWKKQLEDAGYIRTAHTSNHGIARWWVLKTKKFNGSAKPPTVNASVVQNRLGGSAKPPDSSAKPPTQLETTERTQRSTEQVVLTSLPYEAGDNAKQDTGGGSAKPPTTSKLFSNPLQPLIDKHGAELVNAVIAFNRLDPFWKSHTPYSVAKYWDTRLSQYQASLVRKPTASKNRWQSTGKSDHIKVAEI